ncbi:MAG: LLM class flavin-dependent oxidoreductase [Streptosporangiaceae bacterium]
MTPGPGRGAAGTYPCLHLGTAVIPLGWENPLRLAEDLATVAILSGGRLNPGVSVGPPMHYDQVKNALYPDTAGSQRRRSRAGRGSGRTPLTFEGSCVADRGGVR